MKRAKYSTDSTDKQWEIISSFAETMVYIASIVKILRRCK